MHRLNLSARAYHRVIKIARTIADLEGKEKIELGHVADCCCRNHNEQCDLMCYDTITAVAVRRRCRVSW